MGFRLKLFLVLLVGVMIAGTLAFAYVEDLSLLDALYFSIVTVATVGYGDIHPTSSAGKIVAIALIITGVGTFLEVIAGITQVMMRRRERELREEKLNMIVGLFFSEMGTKLLGFLSKADRNLEEMEEEVGVFGDWTEDRFSVLVRRLANRPHTIRMEGDDLGDMRKFLERKGDLLLRLLENPTLLEHGSFTELLRSIFHLRDELLNRDDLQSLPESDRQHLAGDLSRVYGNLLEQWAGYMSYLWRNYPYLFSLAMRTNPFDRNANPVIY